MVVPPDGCDDAIELSHCSATALLDVLEGLAREFRIGVEDVCACTRLDDVHRDHVPNRIVEFLVDAKLFLCEVGALIGRGNRVVLVRAQRPPS